MTVTESKPSEFLPHFSGEGLPDFEGSYYFNARWYDADTGRFITEDPIRDGLLWYAYCNNNPMNFVDPTGLEAFPFPSFNDYLYFMATKTQGSGSVIAGAILGDDRSQETLAKMTGVAVMEAGMDIGETVSTSGDIAVGVGAVSVQPQVIAGGVLAGEIGDGIYFASALGKAAITGEREDYTLAIKEMTYKAAGSIVGNVVTRNIRKIPFLHKLVNKYSRNFTDKKVGAFSKEVITTTNDVISSGTGKIVSSGAERASSSRAERTASSGAKSIGSRIRDFFGKNKRESEE